MFTIFLATSCTDDKSEWEEDTYITIQTRAGYDNGTAEDHVISSLRFMAFETAHGLCVINELKDPTVPGTFRQVINPGKYHFVIVANEPETLANISSFAQLENKTIPSKYFTSEYFGIDGEMKDVAIPMSLKVSDIEILASGGYMLNGVSKSGDLEVKLNRLAVRLDITMMSTKEFTLFDKITISGLPETVPVLDDKVNAAPLRNISRTIAFSDFTKDIPLTPEEQARKIIWKKQIQKRLIFPSNLLADEDKDDPDKAVSFTVNIQNENPRSVLLELRDTQHPDHLYSLPPNTYLGFTGMVTDEIKLDVEVHDWDSKPSDWDIPGNRILNVSHTDISITDLNGARITFQSNMPRVRVLESCVGGSGDTHTEFNDLAYPKKNADGTYSTTRFLYEPKTGEGYMDVLLDGGYEQLEMNAQTRDYTLTLVADDGNGNSVLTRTITVHAQQNGIRFKTGGADYLGEYRYAGVFFRNKEQGERIITGQSPILPHNTTWPAGAIWTAWIPSEAEEPLNTGNHWADWIVLSSTPSFDPGVGTDNPGEAEKYPVIPNPYRGETGDKVTGRGRIYFRIGMKKNLNDSDLPKYFYILVRRTNVNESSNYKVYIRKGENDDFIYTSDAADAITTNSNVDAKYQLEAGTIRSKAIRFSPYNLTAPSFLAGDDTKGAETLSIRGGKFTRYPSQAGAYFQYGLRVFSDPARQAQISPLYRRAYHPNSSLAKPQMVSASYYKNIFYPETGGSPVVPWYVLWGTTDPGDGSYNKVGLVPVKFEELFEVCPENYRRPTDGPIDRRIAHDTRADLLESEFRQSIFKYPYWGDANPNADKSTMNIEEKSGPGTYPANVRGAQEGTVRTFYADGFFDRRPIVRPQGLSGDKYGVAFGTSQVAYVGTLFYNARTLASVFFPAAGRMSNDWGDYEQSRGGTGYYWSSTASLVRSEKNPDLSINYGKLASTNGAFTWEIKYDWLLPKNTYADFPQSIRCVRKD